MDVWWNNHFLCNDWESSNWFPTKKNWLFGVPGGSGIYNFRLENSLQVQGEVDWDPFAESASGKLFDEHNGPRSLWQARFFGAVGQPNTCLVGQAFCDFFGGVVVFFFFLGGGGGLLKTFGLLSAFVFSWNVTRGWEPEYIGDMEPHISGVFQRIRKATNIRNEVFFFFSLRSPKPKQSLNFKGLLDDPFLRILFLNHWAKYGVCLILSPLLKQATFSWQTLSFKRLRSSLFTEFMVFFLGWTC